MSFFTIISSSKWQQAFLQNHEISRSVNYLFLTPKYDEYWHKITIVFGQWKENVTNNKIKLIFLKYMYSNELLIPVLGLKR